MTRTVWRFRLLATCVALTALAFTQSPGALAADTKLDLTQDPGPFLARALHLWDAQAFFGQLQNQAYGYLFPVGPFFWVGHALGVPSWAVQRLWWALLLCVAFLGAARLARLIGLESPLARWTAGLAFCLSPRMMSTLGPVSVESLPYVLAPWVLIPLVPLRDGRPIRRAVLLSAVAVLLMGGINAVATAIAAGLGAVWILSEAQPGIRIRALAAWSGAVLLATLWFVGPLLALGKYSPPFLDWIESSSVTTSITDGSASLRGVTDWVAYVGGRGGPQWPAGWVLVADRGPVLGTVVLAVAGVVGLIAWPGRHRRFLVVSVLVGFLAISSAHVVASAPWATGVAAEPLRVLLDGALAPLRNVHKADVWIRLPLAMGVGWCAGRAWSAARTWTPWERVSFRSVAGGAAMLALVAGVAGTAAPALRGDLTSGRSFVSVPGYWLETAGWLSVKAQKSRALVVPGSAFGSYLWGQSRDEPLQAYAATTWGVRDAVPLGSAGSTRALDAVEALFADGRGDPTLAAYLARMGVGYVVVRNDLDLGASDAPRQSLVHATLTQSGGFTRAATFGPLLGGFATSDLVADGGVDGTYAAVEIYSIDGAPADQRVALADARATEVLQGESEGLLGSSVLATGAPTVRSGDLPPALSPTHSLVTDSGRRWEMDFGRVHDSRSRTLGPDDAWTVARKVHDYDVTPAQPRPVLTLSGVRSVTASSSRGDASSLGMDPAAGPWAAVDESASTAWVPRGSVVGSWWQIDVVDRTTVDGASVVPSWSSPDPGTATLGFRTDSGEKSVTVTLPAARVAVPTGLGETGSLRVTVLAVSGSPGATVGLSDVTIMGVRPQRTLTIPEAAGTSDLRLRLRDGTRSPCVVRAPMNCDPALQRSGEELSTLDRVVTTTGVTGPLRLTVRPTPTAAAGLYMQPLGEAAVASVSSTWVAVTSGAARSAVDRDAGTAWLAGATDAHPRIDVRLPRRTSLSWLRFEQTLGLAASSPFEVTVGVGSRSFLLVTDGSGYVRFPPTATDRVSVTFGSTRPVLSYNTFTGGRTVLPVGVSELVLGEADLWRVPVPRGQAVDTPCGTGPTVTVDGTVIRTRVSTSVAGVLDGAPGTAFPCDAAVLPPGTHHVVVTASSAFAPESLRWGPSADVPATTAPASVEPVTVDRWDATSRLVTVGRSDHARLLELAENANAGWTASLGGQTLDPVRVDGWRQAWIVPAGLSGDVTLDYAPDRLFRLVLVLGLLCALVLVALALLSRRRETVVGAEPPVAQSRIPRWSGPVVGVATALLVAGPLGATAAFVTVIAWTRVGSRARVAIAAAGCAVAVLPAAVVVWPASSSMDGPAAAVVAAAVALGTGVVVGALASVAMPVSGRQISSGAPTAGTAAR